MNSKLFCSCNRTCICFFLCLNFISFNLVAQQKKYTVSNAHAHNDYEHPVPFYTAYNAGFGSIEADIFLVDNHLYVAHYKKDIDTARTLQSLYLDQLKKVIKKNRGYAYADRVKKLILLIDLKTEAEPTLQKLVKVLDQYKKIISCKNLKIIITGNQPEISKFNSYPHFIFFDGHLDISYSVEVLKKVGMFSDNFRNYSLSKGDTSLDKTDRKKIGDAVAKAHAYLKPIRFWAAPDTPLAWNELMKLNVDYINTDKIPEISAFLKMASSNFYKKK